MLSTDAVMWVITRRVGAEKADVDLSGVSDGRRCTGALQNRSDDDVFGDGVKREIYSVYLLLSFFKQAV